VKKKKIVPESAPPPRLKQYEALIFITGAVALSLEVLASRIMTPYFGVSLYIWAGILSITLIFLALGYQLGVKVIETPGKDYVSDMGYVVQTLKLGVFLAIAADLPLVRGEMIDAVVERYERCGKPALTVAVPLEIKAKLGMCIEYSFKAEDKDVVPVGINVIDGRKRYGDEWLDQDIYLMNIEELAVNINTLSELQLAERLLSQNRAL